MLWWITMLWTSQNPKQCTMTTGIENHANLWETVTKCFDSLQAIYRNSPAMVETEILFRDTSWQGEIFKERLFYYRPCNLPLDPSDRVWIVCYRQFYQEELNVLSEYVLEFLHWWVEQISFLVDSSLLRVEKDVRTAWEREKEDIDFCAADY